MWNISHGNIEQAKYFILSMDSPKPEQSSSAAFEFFLNTCMRSVV